MSKKLLVIFVVALVVLPLALFGCKGKTEKAQEEMKTEATDTSMTATQEAQMTQVTEPSAVVATETIPPTAAPQVAEKVLAPLSVPAPVDKNKQIQTALKRAGFYSGSIDGIIGPKTKLAIQEFQRAKGLSADGVVGPKTWAELEKYLAQQ